MRISFHHAHLFASDLDRTVRFYQEMFGAEVLFDMEMAGSRNVMIAIGNGRLNLYEQPPRDEGRGPVHHLGIETDDLEGLVDRMRTQGYTFRNPVRDLGSWKYTMAEGPDRVLLELFQVVRDKTPGELYGKISCL
jgi:catechol 2,3-dioxygenase-like lactoylglutathione lyase family enzyme